MDARDARSIQNAAIANAILNYSVGKAVPGPTSSAATLKTTQVPAASLYVVINGNPQAYLADLTATALAAVAGLQHPVTNRDSFYIQPAATTVYYLIVLDTANAVKVIQGSYAGQVFTSDRGPRGDGEMPFIALEGYAPIGAFKVVTGTTAFTPATTNLDATTGGMVITFASINRLSKVLPTFA